MSSPPSDDSHNELKTLRNKQIEIVDRLDQLEGKITQFSERMRKLEEIVARHDSNSQRRPPYQR
jgi:predicted nuclease with TOPRIM domain